MSRYTQEEWDAMHGKQSHPHVILVGAHAPTLHAYKLLKEEGINVRFEQQPMSSEWQIRSKEIDMPTLKAAEMYYHSWSPSTPKPKHHNAKYNHVNRNKNKASRKARKQTRRNR